MNIQKFLKRAGMWAGITWFIVFAIGFILPLGGISPIVSAAQLNFNDLVGLIVSLLGTGIVGVLLVDWLDLKKYL